MNPFLYLYALAFLAHSPWLQGEQTTLEGLVEKLLEPRVWWEEDHNAAGSLLWEFLAQAWTLSAVS